MQLHYCLALYVVWGFVFLGFFCLFVLTSLISNSLVFISLFFFWPGSSQNFLFSKLDSFIRVCIRVDHSGPFSWCALSMCRLKSYFWKVFLNCSFRKYCILFYPSGTSIKYMVDAFCLTLFQLLCDFFCYFLFNFYSHFFPLVFYKITLNF